MPRVMILMSPSQTPQAAILIRLPPVQAEAHRVLETHIVEGI
jgi:hypothetical protein